MRKHGLGRKRIVILRKNEIRETRKHQMNTQVLADGEEETGEGLGYLYKKLKKHDDRPSPPSWRSKLGKGWGKGEDCVVCAELSRYLGGGGCGKKAALDGLREQLSERAMRKILRYLSKVTQACTLT